MHGLVPERYGSRIPDFQKTLTCLGLKMAICERATKEKWDVSQYFCCSMGKLSLTKESLSFSRQSEKEARS